MAKSILVINGSPRAAGNTDAILQMFLNGVKNTSHEPIYRKLRELNIANCIGCCKCRDESVCELQDDMSVLRKKIEDAKFLVFATPNYWCEVTGLMKTFIDRLYFYHHQMNSSLIAGKKAIVISTMGEASNIAYESALLIEFFSRALRSLKIEILDIVLFFGLMEKNDIEARPEYLRKAFSLGKELASR
jgi:multimeric flavodoxin WrbA